MIELECHRNLGDSDIWGSKLLLLRLADSEFKVALADPLHGGNKPEYCSSTFKLSKNCTAQSALARPMLTDNLNV